jgi:hypothetical protein
MRKKVLTVAIVVLAVMNLGFLWQNHSLKQAVAYAEDSSSVVLTEVDGIMTDLRGMYTYPGIGRFFVSTDSTGMVPQSPLTLVVVFSAETSCPASLSETAVFKRLLPIFRERGQSIVAVTARSDSAAIAELLAEASLDIPLMAADQDSGFTFIDIGISPVFTPFKILYDSTYTAIYMRGADNSPESQAGFEDAALWLSEAISKK